MLNQTAVDATREITREPYHDADAVMAHHAKTFYWANRLIPREFRRDFAVLYAFCRLADDTVDETPDAHQARNQVQRILCDLDAGSSDVPAVSAFLELCRRRSVPLDYAHELLIGVVSDIGAIRVQGMRELLRYAYRVASTVGLMVCRILNVTDPQALAYAIDLGVAMQLTNIARDVVEDAESNRVYLPAECVDAHRVLAACRGDVRAQASVYPHILELLEVAEQYYRSADSGMCYLPPWARWGILTASRCYEAIGTRIRQRQNVYWSGRVYTPSTRKALLTLSGFGELLIRPRYWSPRFGPGHDAGLHQALAGLPETHSV